jgi:hypothetical protein
LKDCIHDAVPARILEASSAASEGSAIVQAAATSIEKTLFHRFMFSPLTE